MRTTIQCEVKDIIGTSSKGFDGQRHPEDCTPENCYCYEAGLASVLSIRCMKHIAVPQQNKAEHGGGECGGCISEEFRALREATDAILKRHGWQIQQGLYDDARTILSRYEPKE